MSAAQSHKDRFAVYAWLVLAYNIAVILWGAIVRATGSGNGCGDHWPLCQGQVIPHAAQIATVIEFAHRLTSGVDVLLVLGLVWLAFRRRGRGHRVRRYAAAAVFFTFTEGLLGAALVLTGDVGSNASLSRVFVLSLHLVNTFLLLASLALAAKWAGEGRDGQANPEPPSQAPRSWGVGAAYGVALLGTLALAVTGTIAALADTLFPAKSLEQGFAWDLSGGSPLLRLRIIHPALAVFVGTFLIVLAVHTLSTPAPFAAKRAAAALALLVALQFCLGLLNVLLLTPIWVQVMHLLTADLIWIALVLTTDALMVRQPVLNALAKMTLDRPILAAQGSLDGATLPGER